MADRITGLYEGDRLAAALLDARERTLAIYAHLDLARLEVPCLPIVNPPLWELAHIAWFQEYWCLRHSETGVHRPPRLEGADALFDSRTVPHDSRWTLAYPPPARLRAYMRETLEATLEELAHRPVDERYFFHLALLHEDMHGEALVMTLQSLGLAAPRVGAARAARGKAQAARDIRFAGGPFGQGVRRDERGFVFDNEKWRHRVEIAPFAMADRPVSCGEFADFVDDGGYARQDAWTSQGWTWRESSARSAPRDWRREGGVWSVTRFDRREPLDRTAPMMHVTLHEARAYCRWAGRRLPSESEWEFAACNGGREDRYPWDEATPAHAANLDYRYDAPFFALPDPAPSRSGLRSMIGTVWEWTDTPFAPYPGFAPDPYREYSQPWFDSHFVLRGGSFVTRSRLVHNRFRNFYLPHRDDVFAGFRTCAVESR